MGARNPLFSERFNLTPPRQAVQMQDMDEALRIGLWNVLQICIWDKEAATNSNCLRGSNLYVLLWHYWDMILKEPLDQMPFHFYDAVKILRKYFFSCAWYEVYDFMEFTIRWAPIEWVPEYLRAANEVLERELSAYRFVGRQLAPIASRQEDSAISTAMHHTADLMFAHAHLRAAMEGLFGGRPTSYRDSIENSLLAVNRIVAAITGNPDAPLRDALQILENSGQLSTALRLSLSALFAATMDQEGLHHVMLGKKTHTFDDAKFMLVICTAFINYLTSKTAAADIPFPNPAVMEPLPNAPLLPPLPKNSPMPPR